VICDITMPVMDGHTLLSELRSNHPERSELPFLFLTALADRDNLVKGKKLGADDYLTKPVD
jgi:CheY-like chemotaxis protein